jgi:hypothetical protein
MRRTYGITIGVDTAIKTTTDAISRAGGATGTRGGAAIGKGAAAAGTVGATAVQGLILAAGASSAVPVAGWIVAGGLALAAGTIAFVSAMRKGRMSRRDAIAKAQALGLPEAASVPGFTVKLMNATSDQRVKLAFKVESQLKRKQKAGIKGPGTWFRKEDRLDAKLALIGAVEAYDMAQKRGAVPTAAPPPVNMYADTNTWLGLGLGSMALLLAVFAARRR